MKMTLHALRSDRSQGLKHRLTGLLNSIAPLLGLMALLLFFYIVSDGKSLMMRNVRTLINQLFTLFIVAVGSSFVFAQGNIDLSLGGIVGMSMLTGALSAQTSPLAGLLVALATGAAIGFLNGFFHAKLGVPAFLMTLAMQFALRGVIGGVTSTLTGLSLPGSLEWIDERWFKIVVMVALFLIAYLVFEYTKIGKFSRAIGSNAQAAAYSGVDVARLKIIAYCISGLFAGLAGFFGYARSGSVSAQSGTFVEMDNLVALVLGGMPLTGGYKARLRCALIGSLMMVVLSNGLILWGIDENLQQGIKGIILIIAVAITYERTQGVTIK